MFKKLISREITYIRVLEKTENNNTNFMYIYNGNFVCIYIKGTNLLKFTTEGGTVDYNLPTGGQRKILLKGFTFYIPFTNILEMH